MKRALIFGDDAKLPAFAGRIAACNWQILSTGAAYDHLTSKSIPCTNITEMVRFPKIFDGQMAALQPAILGGIICDQNNPAHFADAQKYGIGLIHMVVVNLDKSMPDLSGQILLLAAAQNFVNVIPVPAPTDYDWVAREIEKTDGMFIEDRNVLAGRAFRAASLHSGMNENYLAKFAQTRTPIPSH